MIINLRKPETDRVLDERVERINEKAGYFAFWILSLFIALMVFLGKYFNRAEILELLWFAGMLSFITLRIYFSRRGIE